MPARNNATKRLHIAAEALLLAVVAASMVATLSPSEIGHRGRLLCRALAGEVLRSDERTGFWFDPAYEAFLDEVRRRTPRDATIAIVVPSYPDVYVYQAAYRLAPRRVVDSRRAAEADYVAAYRIDARGAPGAVAIPHGTLSRSRR
jgi:hypothetical protein